MSGSLACWHALCLPPDRTLSTRLNYPLHDDSMQQSKKWCSPDSRVFRFFQMDSLGPPCAADPRGGGNIACYGSRLFDIQLIRKYQLWLWRFVYLTEFLCMYTYMHRCENTHWIRTKTAITAKCFIGNQLDAHLTKVLKCVLALAWFYPHLVSVLSMFVEVLP